jgi:hypothetical protein
MSESELEKALQQRPTTEALVLEQASGWLRI